MGAAHYPQRPAAAVVAVPYARCGLGRGRLAAPRARTLRMAKSLVEKRPGSLYETRKRLLESFRRRTRYARTADGTCRCRGAGHRAAAGRRSPAGSHGRHAGARGHGQSIGHCPERRRGRGRNDAGAGHGRAGCYVQHAGAQSDLDLPERRLGNGPDDLGDRRIRLVRGHADRCGRWQLSRRAARRWLDVPRWRVDTTGRDAERRHAIGDAKSSHPVDRDQSVAGPATRTARVHRAKPGGGHAGRRRALREWHVGDWRGLISQSGTRRSTIRTTGRLAGSTTCEA
jgi:hypothetical protein